MTRRVPQKSRLAPALRDVLRLRSLDLRIHQLLQRSARPISSGLHLVVGGSVHRSIAFVEVGALGEGDEVFELGLDGAVGAVALVGYGVVADVSCAVYLEGECVS